MGFEHGVLEMICNISHVKKKTAVALVKNSFAHLYLYPLPASQGSQGDFGGNTAWVRLVQSGPTTFHACQK